MSIPSRYVLYHGGCLDGFGAAWAAWKHFGDSDTLYLPVYWGKPLPSIPNPTEIFILDFSYPKPLLLQLAAQCPVTVLDHHKSAEEDLRDLVGRINPVVVFDMERSGAKMTWEHLHRGQPCPKLIEHISDRDLWRFELPGSKEVHAALVSYPMDFRVWDTLDVEQLKQEGVTCARLTESMVRAICHTSWQQELAGYQVPVVNTTIAWAEVGQMLQELWPSAPFVASFTMHHNLTIWSLRSVGAFDVSAVARKFGGGGHRNAAGFQQVRL